MDIVSLISCVTRSFGIQGRPEHQLATVILISASRFESSTYLYLLNVSHRNITEIQRRLMLFVMNVSRAMTSAVRKMTILVYPTSERTPHERLWI